MAENKDEQHGTRGAVKGFGIENGGRHSEHQSRPAGDAAISAIVAHVMRVDSVSPAATIPALGGGSTQALEISTQIKNIYGVELPVAIILGCTVAEIAARVTAARLAREP